MQCALLDVLQSGTRESETESGTRGTEERTERHRRQRDKSTEIEERKDGENADR